MPTKKSPRRSTAMKPRMARHLRKKHLGMAMSRRQVQQQVKRTTALCSLRRRSWSGSPPRTRRLRLESSPSRLIMKFRVARHWKERALMKALLRFSRTHSMQRKQEKTLRKKKKVPTRGMQRATMAPR